jgi:DNA-binding NtrC family response regulator
MVSQQHFTLEETRWRYILSTLEKVGWDVKKASSLLKVSERFIRTELQKMGTAKGRPGRKR